MTTLPLRHFLIRTPEKGEIGRCEDCIYIDKGAAYPYGTFCLSFLVFCDPYSYLYLFFYFILCLRCLLVEHKRRRRAER